MPHQPHADVVLEHLPAGVVALDAEGRLAAANPAAKRLLGALPEDGGARCCDLVGCRRPGTALETRCIAELVRKRDDVVGELLVQTPAGEAWLTGAPLGDGGVVLHLRPGGEVAGGPDERLRIRALGPLQLEVGGAVLEGDWLSHRPGQVLKYLIAHRGHPVASDELLQEFWPQPDGTAPAATNVRQAVHALRDRLEPDRERQAPPHYVVGRRGGGYELAAGLVLVDADVFTAAAEAGLAALRDGDGRRAEAALGRAAALYRGDFLADEPDAEWAIPERDRLRALAGRVLRALAGVCLRAGELDAATDHLQRLAELEPLDVDAQRQMLTLLLRRGRRTEAARRYEVMSRRFRRAFGEEPSFQLAELAKPRRPAGARR